MNIILLGPPGAGKGTQAKVLAQRLNFPHISTGDLLRQNVSAGTELGKKAKDFMNKGMLVPDELVNQMLVERFKVPGCENGFILDGYPRNLSQAKALDAILKDRRTGIGLVVYLDASDSVIIQRISGRLVCSACGESFHITNMPPKIPMVCDKCKGKLYQRSDDTADTVKQRLAVYKNEVSSLIDYYQSGGILNRVSADGEAEEVLNTIVKMVQDLRRQKTAAG
ncbi:MAG: adenylate kinase [Candidatus Omnitrophica bacterium]|nr:adenylate kinase [Candidatus Omnitrophota bacterium]